MSRIVDELEQAVSERRRQVLATPLFGQLEDGSLTREHYARLLVELYHSTMHTPRLLAAAASRVPTGRVALLERLMANASEEMGHHRLALDDLDALGVDVEHGSPRRRCRRRKRCWPTPTTSWVT